MIWKRILLCIAALLLCVPHALASDHVFQYSTLAALKAAQYEGNLTLQDLLKHGDFGLGTVNGLDGELVVLDGEAYHAVAGGAAVIAPKEMKTPFAVVTRFDEDAILKLGAVKDIEAMNGIMAEGLSSHNVFHAIRLDGRFASVRIRAIPAPEKPYKPLDELIETQVVVKLTSVEGTLVGFWTPGFAAGINQSGFHWHFLTKDRSRGGHVLDCSFEGLVARVDELHELRLALPRKKSFDARQQADAEGQRE